MASAALTVEADDRQKNPKVRRLKLHRDGGFVPSRVERWHVVIEVQNSFVCVALKYSWIIHATCLHVRNPFSFCAASSSMKTLSFDVSVNDFLEATHSLFQSQEPEVCLQLCPGDGIRRLQLGKRPCGLNSGRSKLLLPSNDQLLSSEIHTPSPKIPEIR